jgi:DNA-directed RNA polymerase II subunit RPB3
VCFDLTGVDVSIANGLRRAVLADVPTLAVERVEIESNQTVVSNDFVSHRLGLVLLKSDDAEHLATHGECVDCDDDSDWCPSCSIELEMDVRNVNSEVLVVTAFDLRRSSRQVEHDRTFGFGVPTCEHRRVVCGDGGADDTTSAYLFELAQGHHLSVRAVARKGAGREHAKWSPVCESTFQWNRRITINRAVCAEMTRDEQARVVDSCPRGVLSLQEEKRRPSTSREAVDVDVAAAASPRKMMTDIEDIEDVGSVLTVVDGDACTACHQCTLTADALDRSGAVVVELTPDKFSFRIESTGSMSPLNIVDAAFASLCAQLTTVDAELLRLEDGDGADASPSSRASGKC